MWRTTTLTVIIVLSMAPVWAQDEVPVRLKEMTGKTIMLFGAHPDDEFPAAGTMAILQKNGKLSEEDMGRIRSHPEIGASILADIKQMRDVTQGVLYHHERPDGKG